MELINKVIDILSQFANSGRIYVSRDKELFQGKIMNLGHIDTEKKKLQVYPEDIEQIVGISDNVAMITTLEIFIHYLQNNNREMKVALDGFDKISLLISTLSIEEQAKIIFYLCEQNAMLTCLEENLPIYDLDKIYEYRIQKMQDEDLNKLIYEKIFPSVFTSNSKTQTQESIETRAFLMKRPKLFALEDLSSLNNSRKVKEHYLDKLDSYTEKDIEEVTKALENLKVNNKIIKEIRKILIKALNRRMTKLEPKKTTSINSEVFKRPDISKRNEIYKKLDENIDLRNMSLKKRGYWQSHEIVNHVEMLLNINANPEDIDEFLRNVKFENDIHFPNFIAAYVDRYDKFKYYEEKMGVSGKLEEIDACFQEMFISSDEDYREWKEIILSESGELCYYQYYHNSFEYELETAKKRLKRKK